MTKTYSNKRIKREYTIIKSANICICAFAICLFFDYFLPTKDHLQVVENSYLSYPELHHRNHSIETPSRMLRTEKYKFKVWLNAYQTFPPGDTVIISTTSILDTPRAITQNRQGAQKHTLPYGIYAYFMFFPTVLLILSGSSVFMTNKYLSIVAGGLAILFSIWVTDIMYFYLGF